MIKQGTGDSDGLEEHVPEPQSPDAATNSVLEYLRRLSAIRRYATRLHVRVSGGTFFFFFFFVVVELLSLGALFDSWIVTCFSKMGLEIELEADLFTGLKNGIVLCYLMQNFEPESIPRIHESASQSFNYRQNIVFFLAACEMVGVPKNKLFRVGDLWENASMVNVVDTLVALAHTCEAKWPGRVAPFVLPSRDEDAKLLASVTPEERVDILKQIKMSSTVSVQMKRMTTGYRLSLRDVTTDVKSRIGQLAGDGGKETLLQRGVTRCQAVFRGLRERQNFQHRLRDSAYRERVAYEILSTEQTYVDSLAICVDVYLRPLEAAAAAGRHVITEDRIAVIFKGLETILAANRKLLASLAKRLEKWHPNMCVGDVFGFIDGMLPFYTEYIQNYTEAVRMLKREQRKKLFKEFLSQKKLDPRSKGRELDQFLIMPVQRIPRYNLLLRELVKHTWLSHPDFAVLDASVERLANIAMFLNEKKREAEALQRTFHVQEILDKASVNLQVAVAGRKYLYEGELYDGQGKAVVMYLFNDLMVLCGDKNDRAHTEADERRANRKKIKFSEFWELDPDMVVLDVVDDSGKFAFAVTLPSRGRTVQLNAASQAVKKEWLDMLRAVQAKLSTLALLHLSPGADASPQLAHSHTSVGSSRNLRSSKKTDGPARATPSHRRSKSKVDDLNMYRKSESSPGGPNLSGEVSSASASHSNSAPLGPAADQHAPPLPEKKRFFPLTSPRSERVAVAADTPDTPPTKTKSRKTVAKLGAVSSTGEGVNNEDEYGPGEVAAVVSARSESEKKGSIRVRLGAVMRLTNLGKLWKDDEEESNGAMLSPDVRHQSAGEISTPPMLSKRETELAKRTDSDDLQKLGRLMRGRTKKPEEGAKDADSDLESKVELKERRDSGAKEKRDSDT